MEEKLKIGKDVARERERLIEAEIEYLVQDVENIGKKDFLAPAICSHLRHYLNVPDKDIRAAVDKFFADKKPKEPIKIKINPMFHCTACGLLFHFDDIGEVEMFADLSEETPVVFPALPSTVRTCPACEKPAGLHEWKLTLPRSDERN